MSSKIKKHMLSLYGENQERTEAPEAALCARCENGLFAGRREGDVLVFRGIPFAMPPVGERRWRRPEPPAPSDRIFEAYYNGKTPIQTELDSEPASFYPQGEDCLYLNIWIGADREKTGKAVMVFFHGGSYGWGGTADPMYDGKNLVQGDPDIVLVTVGYRTGLAGFMDFSSVPGGEAYPDAPNLGILDQIEALRWVRRNIAAFGGDPDNVTIFGESAGGGSVSLLPLIDEARGLFRRVIAQSGSVALTFSREESQSLTRRLLQETGMSTMAELAAMPEEQLKQVNEKLNDYNNFPMRDGRLIPEDPYVPYDEGKTAGIDLLMGTNANEMNYWVGEMGGILPFHIGMHVGLDNDGERLDAAQRAQLKTFLSKPRGLPYWKGGIFFKWIRTWRIAEWYNEIMFRLPMIRQAEGHSRHGGRVFIYNCRLPSVIPYYGACHAVELSYVFGNVENTIYTGAPVDAEMSRQIRDMWTGFARTGDPSTKEAPWPAYTEEKRTTMILEKPCRTEENPLPEQREMLMSQLECRINPSYAEKSYHVPYVRRLILKAVALLAVIGYLIWTLF